jgi:hypothetical protein
MAISLLLLSAPADATVVTFASASVPIEDDFAPPSVPEPVIRDPRLRDNFDFKRRKLFFGEGAAEPSCGPVGAGKNEVFTIV